MDSKKTMLTPPEVAERWGVDADKVLNFIRTGELRAVNLATNANGKRPRYRVALSEVERFEEARSTKVPPLKQRQRKRKSTTGREWF